MSNLILCSLIYLLKLLLTIEMSISRSLSDVLRNVHGVNRALVSSTFS